MYILSVFFYFALNSFKIHVNEEYVWVKAIRKWHLGFHIKVCTLRWSWKTDIFTIISALVWKLFQSCTSTFCFLLFVVISFIFFSSFRCGSYIAEMQPTLFFEERKFLNYIIWRKWGRGSTKMLIYQLALQIYNFTNSFLRWRGVGCTARRRVNQSICTFSQSIKKGSALHDSKLINRDEMWKHFYSKRKWLKLASYEMFTYAKSSFLRTTIIIYLLVFVLIFSCTVCSIIDNGASQRRWSYRLYDSPSTKIHLASRLTASIKRNISLSLRLLTPIRYFVMKIRPFKPH